MKTIVRILLYYKGKESNIEFLCNAHSATHVTCERMPKTQACSFYSMRMMVDMFGGLGPCIMPSMSQTPDFMWCL